MVLLASLVNGISLYSNTDWQFTIDVYVDSEAVYKAVKAKLFILVCAVVIWKPWLNWPPGQGRAGQGRARQAGKQADFPIWIRGVLTWIILCQKKSCFKHKGQRRFMTGRQADMFCCSSSQPSEHWSGDLNTWANPHPPTPRATLPCIEQFREISFI